jgi:signal transduction histidine kinase
LNRTLSYLFAVAAALAITLLLIALIMNPPMGDLMELGWLLSVTALTSGAVGYLSHRMGWWRRLKSLATAIALSYLIAAALTLLNVWLTARLMFINAHDLALAILLLLFASGISVSFGAFISSSVTQALRGLARGVEKISEGDFTTRLPVEGNDEVARLTAAFNQMSARLQQAANDQQALEDARRNLVAWASHDLRTPLASLRAMIDALAEGIVADRETTTRYLRQSQQEISRMNTLITDLFELAQIDAGGLELRGEPASLSDLISDTLGGFAERARGAGVLLEGSPPPGVDPVFMSPDKISRVLHNLLDNAIRHTPEGGRVCLEAVPDNGSVRITVRDTGAGISAEDLPRIFDRFYRGEKSRSRGGYAQGGAGLGLAIAKGIVEAHGGQIWAHNAAEGGAVFQFTLPRNGA